MKRIIVYLFLLSIHLTTFSQAVKCNHIEFSLIPITPEDTAYTDFVFRLKVEMDISVFNIPNDTLTLKTKIKLGELGPKNLSACLVEQANRPLVAWIDNHKEQTPFNDTQYLKILIPDNSRSNHLKVSYTLIGTGLFFYLLGQNHPNVFAFHQWQEAFYPINIPVKSIHVVSPDNSILAFSNLEEDCAGNSIIDLTFINKKRFRKEFIQYDKIKLHIFIPDTIADDSSYRDKLNTFYSYVNNLAVYMKEQKEVNVILLQWRDEKNRRTFGKGLNPSVFDLKFPANSMLHEVIHQICPCEVYDGTKGEYFIKESIVEWLSYCLSGKLQEIDTSVITTAKGNLYNTNINHLETWSLIYSVGAAILQEMAQKVGYESLLTSIFSFFYDNTGKFVTYDDFIAHLKRSFSTDIIEKLDAMVKGEK